MTATPEQQAQRVAQLVRDGVADAQTAFDHVMAEERGRQIAARVNAQRTTPAPQQPKTEVKQ